MTTLTQSRPISHATQGGLSGLLARYRAWADTRATRHALRQLSDRELADIGITRGDIEYIATRG